MSSYKRRETLNIAREPLFDFKPLLMWLRGVSLLIMSWDLCSLWIQIWGWLGCCRLSFVIAELFLLIGAIVNSIRTKGQLDVGVVSEDENFCRQTKKAIFAVGAAFTFLTMIFSIGYIFQAKTNGKEREWHSYRGEADPYTDHEGPSMSMTAYHWDVSHIASLSKTPTLSCQRDIRSLSHVDTRAISRPDFLVVREACNQLEEYLTTWTCRSGSKYSSSMPVRRVFTSTIVAYLGHEDFYIYWSWIFIS